MSDTKILLIDAEQPLGDNLKKYFENEEYDVKVCSDGVEGIDAFKSYELTSYCSTRYCRRKTATKFCVKYAVCRTSR